MTRATITAGCSLGHGEIEDGGSVSDDPERASPEWEAAARAKRGGCACNCADIAPPGVQMTRYCTHVWDGPNLACGGNNDAAMFRTATCSRCGEWAVAHDERIGK